MLMPISISTYEGTRKWIFKDNDFYMEAGCLYEFRTSSGAYLAFCTNASKGQATDELEPIPLSTSTSAPKSILSGFLKLDTDPFKREICFESQHFIQKNSKKFWQSAYPINIETSLFLYPKAVDKLSDVDTDELKIINFRGRICPKNIEGMRVIGIGNREATFFDETFVKAINDDIEFLWPTITKSGGKVFANGKEIVGTKIEGGTRYETEVPLDLQFNIEKDVRMYSQLSEISEQILLIGILVFSAWITVIKALIENSSYLLKYFK